MVWRRKRLSVHKCASLPRDRLPAAEDTSGGSTVWQRRRPHDLKAGWGEISSALRWLCLLALCVGCASQALTANSQGTSANVSADAPQPIAQSHCGSVDGARLFRTGRGDDRRAPLLLWLHGGPGGAERPLFRYFDGDLERDFVVAYWDQRGTGRSFDDDADPHELTITRHLAD